MDNPVAIVQRQTLPWNSITDAEFKEQSRAFCQLWDKPEDYAWRMKTLWDNTFSLGYFEVRAKIKHQATCNQQNVACSDFIHYQQYQNIADGYQWYIFIDDDDWIKPDLVNDLPAYENSDALLWRATNLGGPRSDYPLFSAGLNGKCMTNNYAVSGRWLNQQRISKVSQHKHAWFTLQEIATAEIDAFLSLTNKTPISSVSLERGLAGDWSPAKLHFLIEDYLAKMAILNEQHTRHIPWAIPQIEKNTALFQAVLESSK